MAAVDGGRESLTELLREGSVLDVLGVATTFIRAEDARRNAGVGTGAGW